MEEMESIFQRVLLSSLQRTPDAMLRECLGICMELSGAVGGSILGEEGTRLEFLFSNVESLIGVAVPWDSIAGSTVRSGSVIYTFAPSDRRHFRGVDERISGRTEYLLSVPIPSVHTPNQPAGAAGSSGALQLLFDRNIMPEYDVSSEPVEFSVNSVREQPCYERCLKSVFWLLPTVAFGLEILRLRQTSYQVIHELKNKLIGVQSWVTCLGEDLRDTAPAALENDDIAEDLDLTQSVAHEGAELAKSYLQFTKLYNPSFEESDVNRIVRETAASLRAFATDLGCEVAVETDLDPRVPLQSLDPDQMKMALFNLGKNAVEALCEAGLADSRITFRSHAAGAGLTVSVGDNGPGMPEEVARVLFQPFSSKKEGGTGLGLAITKKIVDVHGGVIRCETGSDGTRFVIELKLQTEAKEKEA